MTLNNKTILTASAMMLSLVLILPMVSQNVYAVSTVSETSANTTVRMPVTPQENNPEIASNGKIAMHPIDEIHNAKTANDKALLEKQLDVIKKKMESLGVPTTEEFQKNPQYWISKATGVNMTPNASLSTSCTCPYMQFELAYKYPCYGIFTCDAYYPGWDQLQVGQSSASSQVLGIGANYAWITPYWLVQVNGANSGHYTYSYVARDTLHGTTIDAKNGPDVATNPSSGLLMYTKSMSTIYNAYTYDTLSAAWHVVSIP